MSSRGKKKKALHPKARPTQQQKTVLPCENGIAELGLKRAFEKGYRIAQEETIKACYAAVCLALKETVHFGRERILRVLISMDGKIVTTIDSEEMINKVFDETGIQMDFNQPFSQDRITRKDEHL